MNHRTNILTNIFYSLAIAFALAPAALAADAAITHGPGALQLFDAEGFANSPQWVQIWIGFMGLSFVLGLLFVKNHSIARWVVGGFILGMVALSVITPLFGLQALSGLIATIHLLFWSPALYQLLSKKPFMAPKSAFSLWSGLITFVILFSFFFDIRDAYIYLSHMLIG